MLGQLDDLLAKPDDKWPLRAPAAAAHADWPAPERLAFTRAIDAAIAGAIRPAFERYRAALRAEILPRARDEAHAGISNVPGGAACYAKLVKVHTSLEHPGRRDPPHRPRGAGAHPRRDGRRSARRRSAPARCRICGASCAATRRAFFRTRGDVEAAARKALARAQAAEPRFLGRLPRTPCVVKRIEEFEEKDAPIAYYRPAADRRLAAGGVLRQHVQARDAAALRGRGAGLPRVGARPPHPDRDRAGADRAAGVPQARRRHRVRRGVGPVRRGAGRRAGAVQGRARAARAG